MALSLFSSAMSVVSAGVQTRGVEHSSIWRTDVTYPYYTYLIIALLVNGSLSNGHNGIL